MDCYFRIKIETEFSNTGVEGMIDVPHDIRDGLDTTLYSLAAGQ